MLFIYKVNNRRVTMLQNIYLQFNSTSDMFYKNRTFLQPKMAKRWGKLARLQRTVHIIGQEDLEVQYIDAILKGDAELIQECIERGISPNFHRGDQYTALHMAAENGNIKLINILLQHRETNIDARTINGSTPLNLACTTQTSGCVEVLLKRGANVEIADRNDYRPIHHASLLGHVEIVKMLLKYRPKLNEINIFGKTPLLLAAVDNPNKVIVKMLVNNGADINFHGWETLPIFLECAITCSDTEHFEIMQLLLELGANINEQDPNFQRTALHMTAMTGYEPLAELLLRRGADKTITDFRGETAFHVAQRFKNLHIAYLLVPDN